MDLNEINQVNGAFIKPERNEKSEKKENLKPKEKKNLKEVPKSPDYWQNAIGIKKSKPSFKGDSAEGVLTPEEFDKYYRQISKYTFFRKKEDMPISTYKEHIQELIPLGEEKVKNYCTLAGKSFDILPFSQKENEAFFLNSALEMIKATPELDDEQFNKIYSVMFYLFRSSLPEERMQNFIEVVKAIFKTPNAQVDTKINWLYSQVAQYSAKDKDKSYCESPEEAISSFENYNELQALFSDNEAKKSLLKANLSPEEYGQVKLFFNDGNADQKRKASFLATSLYNHYYDYNPKDILIKFLGDISQNEEKSVLLGKLLDPRVFKYPISAKVCSELFEQDTEKLNLFVDSLIQLSDESDVETTISNPRDFQQVFPLLNTENMDDFFEEVKKTGFSSAVYEINQYKNPKTGLYDKSIKEASKKIAYYCEEDYSPITTAQACIDMETGQISPIAMDVIETLYPRIEDDTIKQKIQSIPTRLKIKSKIARQTVISSFMPDIPAFINTLKDEKGAFKEENKEFLYDLFKVNKKKNSSDILDINHFTSIMENIKGKDGVVDRDLGAIALKLTRQTKDYQNVAPIFETLKPFSLEKKKEILAKFLPLSSGEHKSYSNFKPFVEFCCDEQGNVDEEKYYIVSILEDLNSSTYSNSFLNLFVEYPESQALLYELANEVEFIAHLSELEKVFEKYPVDEEMKDKLNIFAHNVGTLKTFTDLYENCLKIDEKGNSIGFDQKLFEEAVALIQFERENSYYWAIDGRNASQIIKGEFTPSELTFKEKVNLLNSVKYLRKEVIPKEDLEKYSYLNKLISDVEASLTLNDIGLPIEEESKTNFLKNILSSNNVKGVYTPFEQTIVQSIPTLEQLTNGLPLSYSRTDFLKDLSKICDTEEKIEILKQKTTMTPILDSSQKPSKITGYNGILQLKDLDQNNPLEKQIYDCIHKFMYDNKIQTNNDSLNKYLNDIIGAFPEFINVIGKKQHGTHNYTVDVHSLLVLAYSIEHPNYLTNLSNLDKSLFKLVAIFHDLMKLEGEVDKTHQHSSSLYARSIIPKIIKHPETRDRIFELIDNHHWLEEYATSDDKDLTSKELAFRFRRPNDFEIAKIMANSDLKAVSPEFYESHIAALNDDVINNISEKLNYIYSTGNSILHSRIIAPSKLENYKQTYNGVDYNVINLHDINEDEDMGQYGFQGGIKKKDLQLLVHMVPDENMSAALDTVKLLSSPLNGGVLSESLITPRYKRTYCERKYGVLLSQINTNIINANKSNQGSGCQKDMTNVMSLIFNSSLNIRNNFKKEFLYHLKLDSNAVTDQDFSQFYRQHLANKTDIVQFAKNKIYKIGEYSFSGEQIQNALYEYQENLVDKKELNHNEIVGYTPKIQAVIAKEKSLKDVPQDLLDFAHKYNYPVILL